MTKERYKLFISNNRWAILLVLMVAVFVIDSLGSDGRWASWALFIMTTLLFVGVVGAVRHPRIVDFLAIFLIADWILLGTLHELSDAQWINIALVVVSALIVGGGLVITFMQLFAHAASETERLCSAVFGYLLIALIFALIYWRIETAAPGSFNLPDSDAAQNSSPFFYFSLITISTLGYGDITPASAIARTLAGLQAVTGTLYIAVLIGRIVGRI